jgi:hypothetical protein
MCRKTYAAIITGRILDLEIQKTEEFTGKNSLFRQQQNNRKTTVTDNDDDDRKRQEVDHRLLRGRQ